jgi:hypothetical protein
MEAREWAEEASDPRVRGDFLTVERSWLSALSYEFSERLTRFRNRNRSKE